MSPGAALLLGVSSLVAGGVNAVAGGGSLISFPAGLMAGLSPVVANATNAVAMTPASLAAAWGYRRELEHGETRARLRLLGPPSFLGGVVGSALLLVTPQRIFDAVVPALVLFATVLLAIQNLRRGRAMDAPDAAPERTVGPLLACTLQFAISVYGGYFGAAMGILMLALLDLVASGSVHRHNGIKSLLAVAINGAASVYFLARGAIDLRAALLMAMCASLGGFGGARMARRVRPALVRWAIVAFGFIESAALLRAFLAR